MPAIGPLQTNEQTNERTNKRTNAVLASLSYRVRAGKGLLRVADHLHARAAARRRRAGGGDDVVELDAVVFAPDIAEPVPDIAAQHERIVGGIALLVLVGDEGEERNRGELDLLVGHLIEFRDGDLDGVLEPLEVGRVRRLRSE